jgi:hypothetical protein
MVKVRRSLPRRLFTPSTIWLCLVFRLIPFFWAQHSPFCFYVTERLDLGLSWRRERSLYACGDYQGTHGEGVKVGSVALSPSKSDSFTFNNSSRLVFGMKWSSTFELPGLFRIATPSTAPTRSQSLYGADRIQSPAWRSTSRMFLSRRMRRL